MQGRLNPGFLSVVLDIPFGERYMARSPKVIEVTFMQISKVMHNFMQTSA